MPITKWNWLNGWMDRWMDGWMDGKAVLKIGNSNQKESWLDALVEGLMLGCKSICMAFLKQSKS